MQVATVVTAEGAKEFSFTIPEELVNRFRYQRCIIFFGCSLLELKGVFLEYSLYYQFLNNGVEELLDSSMLADFLDFFYYEFWSRGIVVAEIEDYSVLFWV